MNLRTPGPTPIPREILETLSGPMIDHRGPEFSDILPRVTGRLQTLFETRNDVLLLTASGSGGLEAAVVNTLSPGEQVLAVSIGAFGDRFGKIAKTYGADVKWLNVEWGEVASAEAVAQALDANPDVTSVLVTHNETSTGVTNPLEDIAREVKQRDKLLIVDAVSSLGSLPCRVDAWDLDVVVTGSQKGWMVPPGLTMVSLSARAWEANNSAKMPRAYFDLATAKRFAERGQTPWTPAIPLFYALDLALDFLTDEGLPSIHARHERIGSKVRAAVKDLGLELLAEDERFASNTVTAIRSPEGVDIAALRRATRERGVVLAGGQGKLANAIFRIGHLGYIPDNEIDEALNVLKGVLPEVGFTPAGSGTSS